jgi:hypothetical protein
MFDRYNMVIEQKLSSAKNFSTNAEQLQEVKSTTRWQCVVSKIKKLLSHYYL